jgi:hypothetical protein
MIEVRYDPANETALIDRPGRGWTQIRLSLDDATNLAFVIGAEFIMCKPGTTVAV